MFLILLFSQFILGSLFKSPFLKGVYKPVKKEIKKEIIIPEKNIFRKLNGFFGQIGPNPKYPCENEYALFDGDGMIHGVFFNNKTLVYTNHWVKTKKLLTEIKWGKKMYISLSQLKGIRGLTSILSSEIMKCFKLVPTGYTANTAFMYHNEKLFALHETDTPYRINLNYYNNTIHTGKHYIFKNITTTTAHPKFDDFRKRIYLYSYTGHQSKKGQFIHNVFDYDFNLRESKYIDLINNGIIHDIGQTKYNLIIPDMPLKADFNRMFDNKLPIYFDKKGVTRFGILNKDTDKLKWYTFDKNFFIFHFAECYESKNNYYAYACILDNVHFASFIDNKKFKPFEGTQLSQIILSKHSNNTKIIQNTVLNKFIKNTDYITEFPTRSKLNSTYIYCTIVESQKGEIHGYLKLDLSDFQNSTPNIFLMPDRLGNSEAQPVIIDDKEYLLSYTYNKENEYFLSLIDMETHSINEINLSDEIRIPPGFHSTYINNK